MIEPSAVLKVIADLELRASRAEAQARTLQAQLAELQANRDTATPTSNNPPHAL